MKTSRAIVTMKCIVLVLSLVYLTNTAPTLEQQWIEWKTTYNKRYDNYKEDLRRFETFTENLAKIEAHNAKYRDGTSTFYMGMNKFGDLTANEFINFVNSTNSRKPATSEENLKRHVRSVGPLAAEVDWRTQGVVTGVVDQLDCEASWGFSAVGALESQLAIRNGQLTPLSAQNLVDCSSEYGNSGCDGGNQNNAYDYIQANGVLSAANYPYQGEAGTCRFDSSQSVTSITGHVEVPSMVEDDLQDAVASVGPVTASIHATYYFQFYYGGILFDDTCNFSEVDLNHSVLIIGYGTQLLYDYWLAKNSFGTDWGENGYYKTVRNYGNNCGISTRNSYPQI